MTAAKIERLIREVPAMTNAKKPLAWTTDRPTVPGWYWLRREGIGVECVEVVRAGESLWVNGARVASYEGAEWYGPIEVPE